MADEKLNLQVDNESIAGIIENPGQNKLVILVHGFTGDMNGPDDIYVKLSQTLQEAGYSVLRFNFRGTPPSEGEHINMTVNTEKKDLKAVIKYARSNDYNQIALVGESMGGAIVAESFDKNINAIVFWYPDFDFANDYGFSKYLKEYAGEIRNNGYFVEAGLKVGKKLFEQFKTHNSYHRLKSLKVPVLFLHGSKDIEVPWQQSQKGFELVKGVKKIGIIEGADHCFKNEQDEVITETVMFLRQEF